MKFVAAVLFVVTAGVAMASPLPSRPHVYVEGSAEIEVVPDQMEFSLTIVKVDNELSVAKSDVDQRSRKLIDTLKALNIADKDIATSTLSVGPYTRYKDGERIPAGTRVSRQVDITLRDLNRYPEVMQALVSAEITEVIDTSLKVSDDKSLTDKALVAAMADAKIRAERLAKAEGKNLGGAYSISEFMTRGEERYMLQPSRRIQGKSSHEVAPRVMAPPSEPFEPGVMIARAQVFVVYLLK